MNLEEYLVEGEQVLVKTGDLYATNRRVIKYNSKTVWEHFGDLAYRHIVSLKLVNKPTWDFIIFGLFMAAIGGMGWLFETDIAEIFGSSWHEEYIYIAYALITLGILFMILGFLYRQAYYQFIATGIHPDEWRAHRPLSEETTEFVRVVREHLNEAR